MQEAKDGVEQNATRVGAPSMSRWGELCRHEVEVGQHLRNNIRHPARGEAAAVLLRRDHYRECLIHGLKS
jgi:hypothetical protein